MAAADLRLRPGERGATLHAPAHLTGSRLAGMMAFALVTAILYFGREILIPLALAVLLTFLLAPAVRWLERRKLPRVLAVSAVSGLAFAVIAGVLYVATVQLLALADSLPQYKHNIRSKISLLREEGSLDKAARAIDEIADELEAEEQAEAAADPQRARERLKPLPMPVVLETRPLQQLQGFRETLAPFVGPLGTAAAVIIFTFIMLLQREDLRNRMIRLIGYRQINLTTDALEDAATRVSRFLRMQLIVNVSYGIPVGLGLWLIGVPNPALWGLLAIALRFIPYLGPLLAAALPMALAFAIAEGWQLVLYTALLFLVLELLSNNVVEPWLYGSSTGLTAIAVMVAAVFWTWLWGVPGLLLATPLTVCLVVMGKHVPQFAFLDILLGDAPALPLPVRVYQRLLAHDWDEAASLAEAHVEAHGLEALYGEVLLPTLELLEHDRLDEVLGEERLEFVVNSLRRLLEDLPDKVIEAEDGSKAPALLQRDDLGAPVACIVPARDESDELVGLMLQQLLNARGIGAELLPFALLTGEAMDQIAALQVGVVCISAFPPAAVLHAALLCKRLRARFPQLRIVVALWQVAESQGAKVRQRLQAAGASEVVSSLKQATERVRPARA